MGRSTETFNKKEREKKKLKKQQDKKERAEDRKANTNSGKTLGEMMAYVDENGDLTSVSPDPSKRKNVSAETIQVATPKLEHLPEEKVKLGIVSFFDESKGYGFIKDIQTQESIFFHVKGLLEKILEGDSVTFETEKGQKGLNAVNVSKAKK